MEKAIFLNIVLFIAGAFFTFTVQSMWEIYKMGREEKQNKFKKELIEEITKVIKTKETK